MISISICKKRTIRPLFLKIYFTNINTKFYIFMLLDGEKINKRNIIVNWQVLKKFIIWLKYAIIICCILRIHI